MANDGLGAVLSSTRQTVTYSVCVTLGHQSDQDGTPGLLADAEVSIGGVVVWAGLVNWIEDDLKVNGVLLTGEQAARQRASHEALTRWTDRW